ncbi:MAG: hypothetical protein NUV98_02860 [Candidatus Roizmanbacteria bacterium]|nr:hypothetical protein [Candidatus Roizmanbacteria bacterium]
MGQPENYSGLPFTPEETDNRIMRFSISAREHNGRYGLYGTVYDLYDPEINNILTMQVLRNWVHAAEQTPVFQVVENFNDKTGTPTKRLEEILIETYGAQPTEHDIAEQLQSNTPTREVDTELVTNDPLFKPDSFVRFQYFLSDGEVYLLYLQAKSPRRTVAAEHNAKESYASVIVRLGVVS